MRVKYIATADPTDDRECTVFGETFVKDEWVSVSQDIGDSLKSNQTFEVDESADEEKAIDPAVEELRKQLDELGVEYHPRAGVPKLTSLLEDATKPAV